MKKQGSDFNADIFLIILLLRKLYKQVFPAQTSESLRCPRLCSRLPAASVGHAVQTDQRSNDKETTNTGAYSAARPAVNNTRASRDGGKKGKKRKKKEKGGQEKVSALVCILTSPCEFWESLLSRCQRKAFFKKHRFVMLM